MNNQNKKIIFVPGWLHSLDFYNRSEGLDIWICDEDFEKKANADIFIGHSLGANFILANYYKDVEKLILVNPVLRKNFWSAMGSWIRHAIFDKTNLDKVGMMLNFFSSIKKARRIFKIDYEKILSEIPKEKIFVLRGKEDKYLCSKKSLDIFRKYNIEIIEIDDVDHNWGEVYEKEVEKIINNN